jgi:hypothetical protein
MCRFSTREGGTSNRFYVAASGATTSHAAASSGNSTIASPVATFSPAWFFILTSISTQREFCVVCFDLMIPVHYGDSALNQAGKFNARSP